MSGSVTWRSKQTTAATGQARSLLFISHLLFVLQSFINFESCCWTIYTNFNKLISNRKIILYDAFVRFQSIFNSTNINHGQSYPIFGFWLKFTNRICVTCKKRQQHSRSSCFNRHQRNITPQNERWLDVITVYCATNNFARRVNCYRCHHHFCWGILTFLWNGTFLSRNYDPLLTEMVPFLSRNFDHFFRRFLTLFLNGTIFCWRFLTLFWNGSFLLRNFDPFLPIWLTNFALFWNGTIFFDQFSEMTKWFHICWGCFIFGRLRRSAPTGVILARIFDPFLKWYHFCWPFLTLFWKVTIFVKEFWPFSEMLPFLSRNYDPFLTETVLFLLWNFDPFLKWYHFVDEFWHFSEMVPFCRWILTLFWNGTISVDYFSLYSEKVPFLLRNCDPFLKWYLFCREIITYFWLKWYHFCRGFLTLFWKGTIFVEGFLPFSEVVSFFEELWPFSDWNGTILSMIFDPFLKWYYILLTIFDPFL